MTKALLGSSKQAVRSVNRILQRRNNPAFLAEPRRSRAHSALGEGHGRGEDLGVAAPSSALLGTRNRGRNPLSLDPEHREFEAKKEFGAECRDSRNQRR